MCEVPVVSCTDALPASLKEPVQAPFALPSSDALQLVALVDDQVNVNGVPNVTCSVLEDKVTAGGAADHFTVTLACAESAPF